MANQPRPWFRLRSTIGQPPAPAPRPEAQTAPPPPVVPLVRPGFGRAITFRPIVPPPPAPGKTEPSPLPTPTPQASPSSSSSSSSSSPSPSPSPSPPRAPSPTAATSQSPPQPLTVQLPKAAASPPRSAATPAPPTTTVTPQTPHATTTLPPSPHVRFSATTTSHTVPTTPEQRSPPMLQPVSLPHYAAAPPAAVAPPLQLARGSSNHVTTSAPTPTPPQVSPVTMKKQPEAAVLPPSPPPATSIKTPSPTHSTTPKVPPPSPLMLPPPQLQPGSHYNITDVPQQKTVLEDSSSRTIGNNNYNPQSRAAWHSKPSNGADDKDRIRKRTGGLSPLKQATEAKPKYHFGIKKGEMRGKDKEEMVWSSTDSEDSGIRIITIAGENKGAVMEVGKYSSPTTWTSGSDNVQKNGKGRGLLLKKTGRKESSSSGDDDDHGLEGSSKKKGNQTSRGGAEKATRVFVNSNVQGVNNSIVCDCAFSYDDPGVHLALSRMVAGHGRLDRGFYFKHHQHIGHDDDSLQK